LPVPGAFDRYPPCSGKHGTIVDSKPPEPMLAVTGSLIGHLLYGAIFGAIAGRDRSAAAGEDAMRSVRPYSTQE
jgi:hypothetical protein